MSTRPGPSSAHVLRRRALVALPLVALLLPACSDDATLGSPATAPSPAASSPPAVDPAGAATTPAAPAPAAPAATTGSASGAGVRGTRAVAVYYVADTTNGPRLYREFTARPATTAILRDAVTAMLDVPARDPDYRSLWADGTRVLGVRKAGSTVVVDLSRQAATAGGGAAFEAATLQQLVWTVTAADRSVRAVRLLVEGREVGTLWGHADTSRPLTRKPAAEQLGPVWVLSPLQGGTLKRGGTFGGEATVFEATVSWQLVRGGAVVKKGFANASVGAPGRGRWSAVADVPPGDYVLRAFESSARDGSETYVDDKRVRVV